MSWVQPTNTNDTNIMNYKYIISPSIDCFTGYSSIFIQKKVNIGINNENIIIALNVPIKFINSQISVIDVDIFKY